MPCSSIPRRRGFFDRLARSTLSAMSQRNPPAGGGARAAPLAAWREHRPSPPGAATGSFAFLTAFSVAAGVLVFVTQAAAASGSRTAGAVFGRQASGTGGDECAPGLALGDVGVAAGAQLRLTGNQANFGFHDRTIGSDPPASDFLNQRLRA